MANTRKLTIELVGKDSTSGVLGNAGSSLGKFGAAAAAAAAAVAAAAVGVGVGLATIGSSFEDAYATIRVGTGATGQDLEDLKDVFRDVAEDVPNSLGEVSTAVADLNTRLGLTGSDLEEMSEQMLNLARITGSDVATLVANTTRVFGDWSIATEDQSEALDALFRASQSTGISIERLSAQSVSYGAALRQMGFTFEESIALLGKFEKEGVNAELVLGSLRIALGRIAREGGDPIEVFRETVAQIEATGDVAEANALALELFGARAGPDMAAAIREGRFDIEELFDVIANGSETIEAASDATLTFRDKLDILKNRGFLLVEPAATAVIDKLTEWADWLLENGGPAVEDFVAKLEDLGITAESIEDFFGRLADLFEPIISGFRDTGVEADELNDKIAPLREGVTSFIEGVESAAETARPMIEEIIELIGELIDEMGPKLESWGEQFAETAGAAMEALGEAIRVGTEVIVELWDLFGEDLWDIIEEAFETVIEISEGALQVLEGIFEFFTAAMEGDWQGMADALGVTSEGMWKIQKALIEGAFNIILSIAKLGLTSLRIQFEVAWTVISAGARTWVSNMRSFFDALSKIALAVASFIRNVLTGNFSAAFSQVRSGASSMLSSVSRVFSRLRGVVSTAMSAVLGLIRRNMSGALSTILNLGRSFYNAGLRIMNMLRSGIMAGVRRVVNSVRSALRQIRNMLPFSPVPEGPLTILNNGAAGRKILRMIGDGAEMESDDLRRRFRRSLTGLIDSPDAGSAAMTRTRQDDGPTVYIDLRGAVAPDSAQMDRIVARAIDRAGIRSARRVAVAGRSVTR